ncbi:hypothetical protein [Streptoalloteichus hindustanus]|uniref:Uncharacterized protein n=1 Tax=Streptoalloteichus hindustanus TaxID=2017 RepID=A0A1M5ES20_STRHI|nr:hypothetical protein [Streptoalloteichus hindustanus]SHF81920.1 hypothetical protein SAMN05444320_105105 [Streptoalloteichus hindustanus]
MGGSNEYTDLLPQVIQSAREVGKHVTGWQPAGPVPASDVSSVIAVFDTIDEPAAAMPRRTLAVRDLGPTSLQVAQVASGHVDAFWEYGHDANIPLPGALIAGEAAAPGPHAEVLATLAEVSRECPLWTEGAGRPHDSRAR